MSGLFNLNGVNIWEFTETMTFLVGFLTGVALTLTAVIIVNFYFPTAVNSNRREGK